MLAEAIGDFQGRPLRVVRGMRLIAECASSSPTTTTLRNSRKARWRGRCGCGASSDWTHAERWETRGIMQKKKEPAAARTGTDGLENGGRDVLLYLGPITD